MSAPEAKIHLKWVYQILGIIIFATTIYFAVKHLDSKNFSFKYSDDLLLIHTISSLSFTIAASLFFRSISPLFITLNFCSFFLFPIMGAIFYGSLMVSLMLSKKMELLSDFHDESTPQNLNYETTETFEESIQKNINVEPLVEIIRSHHLGTDLKRGAIETLTQICDPVSVTLLKECLSDPDTEVRFYASSGLSRIEENLNEQILKYKEKTGRDEATAEDFFQYGKSYYEFIYLSIQDNDSLTYYLNMSIDNFLIACNRNKSEKKYKEFLQKAYANAGEHEKSKEIEQELENESKDPVYEAETQFKDNKFKECKSTLNNLNSQWNIIKDVQELWSKAQLKNNES
jgi:hypothetical protein